MNRRNPKPQSNAPVFTERRTELRKMQIARRLKGDADQVKRTEKKISALEQERRRQMNRSDETLADLAKAAAGDRPSVATGRRPAPEGKTRPKPSLSSKLKAHHEPARRPSPPPAPPSPEG